MARAWILGICAVALAPAMAGAQQSDTQQILELLKGMNGRFDQIEERLDRVEQGGAAASAPGVGSPDASPKPDAASSSPAPAPVQPASNGVAVPGWRIDVLPYTDKGPADAPIARVKAPIGPTFFDLHFDGGAISNQVAYKGSAYFNVKTPGSYVFQMRTTVKKGLYSSGRRICGGSIDIEDNNILDNFESTSSMTQSASVDLQEGSYLVSYKVYCVLQGEKLSSSLNDDTIKKLKESGYEISVLGPDDVEFRPFEPSELFFIAPPERKRAQLQDGMQASPSDAKATAVSSEVQQMGGRGGGLTADANFRAAPSRSSRSMGELRAGLGFRVLEQVDSWYRVRLRDGNEGYVHTSLVALQN